MGDEPVENGNVLEMAAQLTESSERDGGVRVACETDETLEQLGGPELGESQGRVGGVQVKDGDSGGQVNGFDRGSRATEGGEGRLTGHPVGRVGRRLGLL